MAMDAISELDTATGKITLYPFLFPENGMRDFFQDAERPHLMGLAGQ